MQKRFWRDRLPAVPRSARHIRLSTVADSKIGVAMFFGLYSKLIAAALVAALLAGIYWRGHTQGYKARDVIAQADIAKRTADALQAEQAARKVEQDLQAKSDAIRSAKNAQINSLGLELAESLKRLRNRPERPIAGDVPKDTGAGNGGCAPSQLYREDAGLVIQIAGDADRLRIALSACQQAYKALTPRVNP